MFAFCKWTAVGTTNPKTHQMFLSHRLQNQASSHKILYLLSWIYLLQTVINVFHLTLLLCLHCLVKLKIRVFVKNFNVGNAKLNKCYYWLWFYLLKKMQLFNLDTMADLLRKTCAKLYHNWPRFVQNMRKTFWCVFRFTVLTAVHLQNAIAKFHKVG